MRVNKVSVLSGFFWTYAERTLAQLFGLVVTIVLARIVTPKEYGVISIATVFITFMDTFATSGFGNALIQKKDADDIDYSSVLYFNILFSFLLYAVIFIISPLIASFYNMSNLCPILRTMGVRIPVAAINSVQQAYVSQNFIFKKFFFATLGGTLISGFFGIYLACHNYGAWSLVAQYLTNVIINTLILWFTVKWRPIKKFSLSRLTKLLSFGWKILATDLLINVYANIQDLIIGKRFSSSDLAYSNRGRQFPSLIATNVNTSINKVLFPVLAHEQENRDYLKMVVRKSIRVGSYTLSPLLVGLAAVASPLINLLLTSKWASCVPYLRIMCIVFLLQPMQTSSIQAFKALGKSGLYLKLEIVKKIFGIFVLLLSVFCFSSVMEIFVGALFAEVFSSILNMPFNKKLLHYSYGEQIYDILPTLTQCGVMYLLITQIEKYMVIDSMLLILIIEILLGIGCYLLLSILFNRSNLTYVLQTIYSIYLSIKSRVRH